jgi:hypothetical protein
MATKPTPTPAADPKSTAVAVADLKSTAVATPMDWRERMKAVVTKTMEAEKPTGNISFKGGRLSIGSQTMPGDKIECIIIDSLFHNKYFDTEYDSKKLTPPACYAFARDASDLKPSDECEDPQGDEDGYCAKCPQNAWGSSPKGGRGKACSNSRRLWVLPASVMNDPAKIARIEALTCDLPPTSVNNFSAHVNDIGHSLNLPPFGVVTEMSVKPHDDYLFQVHFKVIEKIKDEVVLEQLAQRNFKQESEPFPVWPTAEELNKGNEAPANASKKY